YLSPLPCARPPPSSTLFPYTTLFRSRKPRGGAGRGEASACPGAERRERALRDGSGAGCARSRGRGPDLRRARGAGGSLRPRTLRSEEHTSELQSLAYLVCRLLLEKKK